MGKAINKKNDSLVREGNRNPENEKGASVFERLFSQSSEYSSVGSGPEGESFGSQSNLSSLSDSTEGSSSGSSASSDDTVTFNRGLRTNHREACRNMGCGKYLKAIKMFESILGDLLDRFGEEHHRVGSALHNVAVANLRAGQLPDARDAIDEAVRIRKLTLGRNHPKVADSLVECGIILLSLKEYDESLQVFAEALKLREREERHARTEAAASEALLKMAKIRHNIGCVNFEIGNLEAAEESYSKAIEQQRAVFGTWATPFMLMTDTSKPGFLTMASTMCNKGYIHIELNEYSEALSVLFESLKIQETLLEADNKLILSTLDNIAFAYSMLQQYDKAGPIYTKLVELLKESYSAKSQRVWSESLKKLIYCQIKDSQFEPAFDNLRILEEYLSKRSRGSASDLEMTHELVSAVNYHIFKFPSISAYAKRAVGCGACAAEDETVSAERWSPKKPKNGSKMSGHRMSYA